MTRLGISGVFAVAGLLMGAGVASAQDEPMAPPDPSPVLERSLEADYLTPDEARELRVRQGRWTTEDISLPAFEAMAALTLGAYTDPIFDDDRVPAELRAEAYVEAGRTDEALALLDSIEDDAPSAAAELRRGMLRARAMYDTGRFEEIPALVEGTVVALERLGGVGPEAADAVVDAVGLLRLRSLVEGPARGASDLHTMIRMLGKARTELDPLSWRARLAEAELLLERDNRAEAGEAVIEALSLNARSARAWALFGELKVGAFDLAGAQSVAARIETNADGAPVPLAAELRAAALLRTRDADAAAETVNALASAVPDRRALLALRAATEAARFHDDESDRLLSRMDELAPGTPIGVQRVGEALSEMRQYEAAAARLGEARDRAPRWPAPHTALGLMHMQTGDNDAAEAALVAAFELDPFNVRVDNSLRLVRMLKTYAEAESDHFIVRYMPGVDDVLARDMPEKLERIHADVAGPDGIDYTPERKTVIEVHPTHEAFAVRITGMSDIHTIAASTGPVIAMEAPRIGPGARGSYDWARVLQHEYVHTVTLARTGNRIPHWFTEAAAVVLERAPRTMETAELLAGALDAGALFDLDEINIAFVRPRRPSDRQQAYAQGAWMYEFMSERFGADAPLRLMDEYAAGATEAEAYQKVLGVSRDGFMEQFTPWAREQAVAWGLILPEGVPALHELVALPGVPVVDEDAGLPEANDETIDALLEQYPDHPELLAFAAYTRVGEAGGSALPEHEALLRRTAEARPLDPMPRRHLLRLALADPGADPARTIGLLRFLDAREMRDAVFAAEIARQHAKTDRWTEAQAAAERATTISPYDADFRELAATAAVKARDFDAAHRHIRALVDLEPDQPLHERRLAAIEKLRSQR